MSNPDRTLLDQINDAWDQRVRQDRNPDTSADGFDEIIESLHQEDRPEKPSPEFRARLRQQLAEQVVNDHSPDAASPDSEKNLPTPTSISKRSNGNEDLERRRTWFSHIGELAAIVAVIIVAALGVAFWQSDNTGMLPGASGDGADEPAVPTPEPNEPGHWMDVTFEEAQAITPFELRMPEALPDGYSLERAQVINFNDMAAAEGHDLGARDDGEPWFTVVLEFTSGQNENHLIEFAVQNLLSPGLAADDPEHVPASQAAPGHPFEMVRGELFVDDVEILFQEYEDVGDRNRTIYTWFQDGLTFNVTVPAEDEDHNNELIRMIESLVTNRENEEQPPLAEGFAAAVSVSDESSVDAEDDPAAPQQHRVDTPEEAEQFVPFDVIDPRDIHSDYEVQTIFIRQYPEGDQFAVHFHMVHSDEPTRTITIEQMNSQVHLQTPDGDIDPEIGEEHMPPDGTDPPEWEENEFAIDGVAIHQVIRHSADGEVSEHSTWNQDGTSVRIFAVTGVGDDSQDARGPARAVLPEDLEQFTKGIIERRSSDEAPPDSRSMEQSVPQPGSQRMVEGQAEPGGLQGVETLDGARGLAPFELIDENLLPEPFDFEFGELNRHEDGDPVPADHPDIDDPNRVLLFFAARPGDGPFQYVQIIQTSDVIPLDGESIDVDGHPVERLGNAGSDSWEQIWVWEVDGMEYAIRFTATEQSDVSSLDDVEGEFALNEEDVFEIVRWTLERSE